MLLNLVHLMPDLSGALVCPKLRLVAFADPLTARDSARQVTETLRKATAVLSQRRPRTVVWIGSQLATLAASGAADVERLCEGLDWHWIGQGLPDGLPGTSGPEFSVGGLTFRHQAGTDARAGEVIAHPSPKASNDGIAAPCYVTDGRRMILPAFGPRDGVGTDVLSPPIQSLFRRPFQVLMLTGSGFRARPRAKLDGAKSSGGGMGRKMSLTGPGT